MKKALFGFILMISIAGNTQILWDQTGPAVEGISGFSNFFTELDSGIYKADDFEVGLNQVWAVNSISVFYRMPGQGTIMDSIQVTFYDDNNGIPGNTLFSQVSTISVFATFFEGRA